MVALLWRAVIRAGTGLARAMLEKARHAPSRREMIAILSLVRRPEDDEGEALQLQSNIWSTTEREGREFVLPFTMICCAIARRKGPARVGTLDADTVSAGDQHFAWLGIIVHKTQDSTG